MECELLGDATMAPSRLFGFVAVAQFALGSCYRTVSVPIREVAKLEFDSYSESAHVVYRSGDTRDIGHYDSFAISSERYGFREFSGAADASLTPTVLWVSDANGYREFPRSDIDRVLVADFAPDRPLLILGTALIGATALGTLTYLAEPKCPEDADVCFSGGSTLAAIPLGFVIGFVVGFPLTAELGSFQRVSEARAR